MENKIMPAAEKQSAILFLSIASQSLALSKPLFKVTVKDEPLTKMTIKEGNADETVMNFEILTNNESLIGIENKGLAVSSEPFLPFESIDSSGNIHIPSEMGDRRKDEMLPIPNEESPELETSPPGTFQFQRSQADLHPEETHFEELLEIKVPVPTGINETESHESWVTVAFDNDHLISPLELAKKEEIVGVDLPEGRLKNMLKLGQPTEEWLSNIEKLFIHFFLVMFDTQTDSSKLMLEMFPTESSQKIEGTFRILYKMDAELYKDLEHVVFLAQNWIASNSIRTIGQQRALNIISSYRDSTKSEGYHLLRTEDRLRNLRLFIHSLAQIGDLPKRMTSAHQNFKRDTYGAEENEPVIIKRPKSPRVKPGSHYARVVANILCDRPCGRPVSPPDVYADKLVKKYLKSQSMTEKELQEYTDNTYGANYTRKDIFHQINPSLYRKKQDPARIDPLNRNCMLPIYTASYLQKVRDGTCCPRKTGRSISSSVSASDRTRTLTNLSEGFISPRGHYHKYKILSDSSEEWEHNFETGMRTKRKPGYSRGPYGGYVVGMKNYYESKYKTQVSGARGGGGSGNEKGKGRRRYGSDRDSDGWGRPRKSGKKRSNKKIKDPYNSRKYGNDSDDDDDSDDPRARRGSRKSGAKNRKYSDKRKLRHIDSDPDSDKYEHDRRGNRTVRKPGPLGDYYLSKKLRDINSDPNSANWEHDANGQRVGRRTRSRRTKRRPRDIDTDSDSDAWEHNRAGKRTKRKPGYGGKVILRNIDSDPNSEGWEHNKSGQRTKRKSDYENIVQYSQRKLRNIDSDSDSDAWEHNKKGKRTKRKPNVDKYSYFGHKPKRRAGSDDDYYDGWEYDKTGHRTIKNPNSKRPSRHRKFDYPKHNEHRIKDIDSDSDSDAWNHDSDGRRTKRKSMYKPRKAIDSDSDSEAWLHDSNGKRVNRIPGYKPRKSIASDSDSDAWEHDSKGKRTKRVKGYPPKQGIDSDPNSENWDHDKHGKRTARTQKRKGKGGKSKQKDKPGHSKVAMKSVGMHNIYDKAGNLKATSDKLPHLGGGDQKLISTKASTQKSVLKLPSLGKKAKKDKNERDLPQVNYVMKQPKILSKNAKRITESLHKGYALNSDDDLDYDETFNFIPKFYDEEEDDYGSTTGDEIRQPDDSGDTGIDTCWELSEILFNSPFNKNLIPAPENILNYLKATIPKSRWAKGVPIATRKYPNGALFCAMYQNGSGLIFYPHGGLAVAISAPRPCQRVMVIRDPLDGFFFMDKAVLAQLHTIGHGSIYDKNGTVITQYNVVGGFHMDNGGTDQISQSRRWLWNTGGIRLIVKLNKYIRLHVSKLNKIGLTFNGNHRGLFLNAGEGRKVVLLKVDEPKEELIGPKGRAKLKNPESSSQVPSSTQSRLGTGVTLTSMTSQGEMINDLILSGKFSTPVLGYVDKEHVEA